MLLAMVELFILNHINNNSPASLKKDIKAKYRFMNVETNNGITKAIEVLKGNKLFGYVQLQKTERSETAALADILD